MIVTTLAEAMDALQKEIRARKLQVMPVDAMGNYLMWVEPEVVDVRFVGVAGVIEVTRFVPLPHILTYSYCVESFVKHPQLAQDIVTEIIRQGRKLGMKGEVGGAKDENVHPKAAPKAPARRAARGKGKDQKSGQTEARILGPTGEVVSINSLRDQGPHQS